MPPPAPLPSGPRVTPVPPKAHLGRSDAGDVLVRKLGKGRRKERKRGVN